MSLHVETIVYGDGLHSGYFVFPERAQRPLPAVVVLQEAWGLDAHIEDVARRFACAGYAALAPDLYAKGGVRPAPLSRERLAELLQFINTAGPAVFMDPKARGEALGKLPPDAAARVEESLGTIMGGVRDLATHVPALVAATRHLREERVETRGQKIGAVGYCMGGGLVGLLACHDPQLAVACIYYGMSPAAELVPRIACPVYGFYGGEDKRVNDTVPALAEAMQKGGKRFVAHTYPGAGHAFFNENRPTYHVGAARDAFARTLEALRAHLEPSTPTARIG
jgi:carboxymethylenebutenolidase